jgi:hypothetical protein
MWRIGLALFMILAPLANLGCSNNSNTTSSAPCQIIGEIQLYTFLPDQQNSLKDAQPFLLPPSTPVKQALERLGRHLANSYFSKTYANETTDIDFEVLSIADISSRARDFRVAVINMIDTNRDAMGCFFQGSTGGQTTFCMLVATFMQPHLNPPLLDGLILLYNGEILPELDHIDLTGILIPRPVEHIAKRAIRSTPRKDI